MSSSTASTAIWHSPSAIFAAAERVPPHRTAATQAGIHEVEFDSQYQSMFSYKAKNAAFLLEDGRVIVKGGALRSRGRAPVLRRYLHDTLRVCSWNAGKTMLEDSSIPTPRLSAAARCQSKTYANLRPCIPL